MQNPQVAPRRARSPFAAAFLSLIFPGLGHLYAGAPMRALAFAAAPILLLALGAGTALRMDRLDLVGLVFDPEFLKGVFVFNLIALIYRLVAIVDAYRVTQFLNAHAASGDGRLGLARLPRSPIAAAGLLAVLFVMAGSHVVVARYDMLAQDALTSGCIFIGDDIDTDCASDPSGSPDPSAEETESAPPSASPSAVPSAVGTAVPQVSIAPWDGKERLNILLIGADRQGGGHRTDTLITVSIDPVTKQVAMFSLPRDTKDVPVPPGPARSAWGSVFGQKINSFFVQNHDREDLWPGNKNTRGYNGLKSMLGHLYGIDIKYFVEVDFEGFKAVVDAVGGVNVNVQTPVVDDTYPAGVGKSLRLYIPSGLQHMTGAQALRYARSRNTSSDFDRAARQQRVLLSLREQADPQALIPRLPELVEALKKSIKTDIPLDQIDELLGLATEVDTKNIRSYVLSPPLYQDECLTCYWITPKVEKIRTLVTNAFKVDPELEARRQSLSDEGATVWVLNPTSDSNRGTRLAGYLEHQGLVASAPRQRPEGGVPAETTITVYNGAETGLEQTIAYLEDRFKVTVELKDDPAMRADVVILIGRSTPDLRPPASS
ncbi:MAG TPA: LCP family protein [Candidatus Saccharimonadales bacterium]|nr:LCP family protein [Candidatus Saccharimonadales bacterium]